MATRNQLKIAKQLGSTTRLLDEETQTAHHSAMIRNTFNSWANRVSHSAETTAELYAAFADSEANSDNKGRSEEIRNVSGKITGGMRRPAVIQGVITYRTVAWVDTVPGRTFVTYTDGMTETFDRNGTYAFLVD